MEDYYWIWIAQMRNLTFENFILLLKKYKNIQKIFSLNKIELIKNSFLSKQEVFDFTNIEFKNKIKKYLDYIKINNINMVNCFDKVYPQKLNFITNRPIVIFAKGNLDNINNKSIGVVGSRNCTLYGINNAKKFTEYLSKNNFNIVSGLAKGIDSIVHYTAVKNGAKTIAILGSGIDVVYPKENINLYNLILKNNGLIISEYLPGERPIPANFPRRNRIISGISDAIIVVEAAKKSGAIITANYAAEQGKEVFAIPGDINSFYSEGTNNLIKDGANVLTNFDDITRYEC